MSKCLVAMGSNLGDRAATLDAALAELRAADGVNEVRTSTWQITLPVGGENLRHEFLNGAAVLETSLEPRGVIELLARIEMAHGRKRRERWADRTLDLDLLLYDNFVCDTPALVVPHPRMSFRRFVLEPAAEVAGEWVHPTIGWTLARLLDHLDIGADCVAIVSPAETARHELAAQLHTRFSATAIAAPIDDAKWPGADTTWVSISAGATPSLTRLPKLSILLDPADGDATEWTAVARQPGRGPTLQIAAVPAERVVEEAFAAVEAVWPRLGSAGP